MGEEKLQEKPIQYLKKVGPQRAKMLAKLGIYTLRDLLYHFPRDYEDRSNFMPVSQFAHNSTATVKGTVVGLQKLKARKNLTILKAGVHDGSGIFYATWFNQPYVAKRLQAGMEIIVTGKVDKSFGAPQVLVSDYEIISGSREVTESFGRIVPRYPLTAKLNQRIMRQVIYHALEEHLTGMNEFLPAYLLEKYQLPALRAALQNIHFPGNLQQAKNARRRFIFEELFVLQLGLALKKQQKTRDKKLQKYTAVPTFTKEFLALLPFELTSAQKRAWQEINNDMLGPYPMRRLLQGDVGSGKTIIGVLALLKAVESGYQGALMAPTEILAEQHFLSIKEYVKKLGINVALVSGGMPAKEKNEVLEEIASGRVQLVVGTHAIIQETVRFHSLSLVVVDEQHRFGVRQRATLQHKGQTPDVLVMTATPIPRTLAMTLYGDLDVSVIDELPPGRQSVQTYAVRPTAMDKVYDLIEREIKAGRQAYIVCPLVQESEKVDVQPAVETAEHLQKNIFSRFIVGLLHGRMSPAEKEKVMARFREGLINILVTTTVVEVGVDVPNATVITVLDADRFGLAQLHQLRGRVGRGKWQSYCILVAEPSTGEARERLRAMTRVGDGFRLAEIDLQIRGPGEFFGTKQSGLPELRIADPVRDLEFMQTARREALSLLQGDPGLSKPENAPLLTELKRRLSGRESFIDVG